MNALLVIAHGSRRKKSNEEVNALAQLIRAQNSNDFDIVESAFLELADVLIPEGIERCVNAGATHITITPYFLNSGRHVTEDIPHEVNQVRPLYPNVTIQVTPHVGASSSMLSLIIQTAKQSPIS
ncbi:hypothetical protein LCGC14_0670460 [marine sediment metagenome]|uniref:Cobalamin (Vitamin B12) biosynthesis CbiX protein n=1 Tax=marine sediment metagenome TaxID=412755 RepID=A0A0F9TCF7_9ZZZZ|nr:cobalamin biosynthesis protein CbiX [Methylophaga aminisulfidivorans]